jgi:hypothetical protein
MIPDSFMYDVVLVKEGKEQAKFVLLGTSFEKKSDSRIPL